MTQVATALTDQQAAWKKPIDTSRIDWSAFDAELDRPFQLTREQAAQFRNDGYIKLKHVLSPELLTAFGNEITNQVIALNTEDRPLEQRGTYGKAFLQIMNLWTKSEIVKRLVFSKRLGRLAAELMGVSGVRMYHDQALYKEPGGGITPWHADQFYWPVNTTNTVTAWIPLQATPMELGPLAFSATSHKVKLGRDLEISDDSEVKISKALLESGLPLIETPFDLGEISYHYGWTFHRAAANRSDRPRKVMTIIYIEDGCRVIEPKYQAHKNDLAGWMPGMKVGDVVDSPLNPVIWKG
jgi:ectoine hydroxylase-related dioxygenase (phytanoyl-CoA dioxygenase family)